METTTVVTVCLHCIRYDFCAILWYSTCSGTFNALRIAYEELRVLWICNVWVSFCFRIATVFYLWVSEASESGSETVRGECLSWIVRFMMGGDDELDRWNSVYVLYIVA